MKKPAARSSPAGGVPGGYGQGGPQAGSRFLTEDAMRNMARKAPMVFIVDDDESVRKAMKRLMRSAGYNAETFPSAEDFLNRAGREEGDCLILDIRMPGMSGLDLQRELAARGSKLPVIFVTAHEDETTRGQAMAAGAMAVFGKPVEDEALLDAIERAGHTDRAGECEQDDK